MPIGSTENPDLARFLQLRRKQIRRIERMLRRAGLRKAAAREVASFAIMPAAEERVVQTLNSE